MFGVARGAKAAAEAGNSVIGIDAADQRVDA